MYVNDAWSMTTTSNVWQRRLKYDYDVLCMSTTPEALLQRLMYVNDAWKTTTTSYVCQRRLKHDYNV